jgi:prepilin-type N-terminal cleavage/methylation domain-containing protein/prepilin-type processing-associated H-X9-DG protein
MVKRREMAFTLVELLMVIAIISILSSLLMPVLSKARESARSAVCSNNLHQIGMGMMNYGGDWKGSIPFWRGVDSTDGWWAIAFAPYYLPEQKVTSFNINCIAVCPSSTDVYLRVVGSLYYGHPLYYNNGGNTYGSMFTNYGSTDLSLGWANSRNRKMSGIKSPGKAMYLTDGVYSRIHPSWPDAYQAQHIHGGKASTLYLDTHVGRAIFDENSDCTEGWN